jgi:hypothetical protein
MHLSSQNLNDRERDRNGEGERKKQVARHSHRFFFMPRSHVSPLHFVSGIPELQHRQINP